MAWEMISIPENGGRLVYRHIGAHSAWKSSSSLLVKKKPVSTRSRILFGAIHCSDGVSQAAVVRAVVPVERALFVIHCSFVQDVDQQCPILHFCDVTGWNLFINHASIPVNLQGDCDLQDRRPSTLNDKKIFRNLFSCEDFSRLHAQHFVLHARRTQSTTLSHLTIQAHFETLPLFTWPILNC